MVDRGWREGLWGVTANGGDRVSFGGDKNDMKLDSSDGCITL